MSSDDKVCQETLDRHEHGRHRWQERALRAEAALDEARHEVEALRAGADRMTRIRSLEMTADDRSLIIDAHTEFAGLMANGLIDMMSNAKNYWEQDLHAETRFGDVRMIVTTIKPDGISPHQLRAIAEAERDALRAEVERLRQPLAPETVDFLRTRAAYQMQAGGLYLPPEVEGAHLRAAVAWEKAGCPDLPPEVDEALYSCPSCGWTGSELVEKMSGALCPSCSRVLKLRGGLRISVSEAGS